MSDRMSEAADLLREPEQSEKVKQSRKYELEQSPAEALTSEMLNSHQSSVVGRQWSVVSGQSSLWQDILWREWRNTNDEDYAEHLFELIGDEPVGHEATIINTLLGMLYGGMAGLLIGIFGTLSQPLSSTVWLMLVGIGAALGSGGTLLARLLWQRQLSWRVWLARLTLNMAPGELGLLGGGLFMMMVAGLFGWLIGLSGGLGHTIGAITLGILLTTSLGARLVGWMVGLGREPNANHLHKYRGWWLWWRKRPNGIDVEAALQRACEVVPAAQNKWIEVLKNLGQRKKKQEPLENLIAHLRSRDWIERFTASYLLAASGGEAVAYLLTIASRITSPQRSTAIRLLQSIEQETTARLAEDANWLLCPRCLACCDSHTVSIADELKFSYYGCRMCGQSREFWEGDVVAVLDTAMGSEPLQENGTVRINWLARRELFDFHAVEIVQASDEEVERFAVQVGNDTDPLRRSRYKWMHCVVGPDCHLSENTLRILGSIFAEVIENR